MEIHINSKHVNQKIKHNYQTKTNLSPQGPQWSRHSVARVQRQGEYSTSSMYLANTGRQGILVFY